MSTTSGAVSDAKFVKEMNFLFQLQFAAIKCNSTANSHHENHQSADDKTHIGQINILYIIMFKIMKIKPYLSSVWQKPNSFRGKVK